MNHVHRMGWRQQNLVLSLLNTELREDVGIMEFQTGLGLKGP